MNLYEVRIDDEDDNVYNLLCTFREKRKVEKAAKAANVPITIKLGSTVTAEEMIEEVKDRAEG